MNFPFWRMYFVVPKQDNCHYFENSRDYRDIFFAQFQPTRIAEMRFFGFLENYRDENSQITSCSLVWFGCESMLLSVVEFWGVKFPGSPEFNGILWIFRLILSSAFPVTHFNGVFEM